MSVRPSTESRLPVTQDLPVGFPVTSKLVSPLGDNVANSGSGGPLSVRVEPPEGPVTKCGVKDYLTRPLGHWIS